MKRWTALEGAAARLGFECLKLEALGSSSGAAIDAALHNRVTACMFFNDMAAIGALNGFAERSVAVPGEISIVGCDGIFGSDFCNPPLTTLAAPIDEVARIATDMLLSRLTDTPARNPRARGPARLVFRQSAAAVRASRNV